MPKLNLDKFQYYLRRVEGVCVYCGKPLDPNDNTHKACKACLEFRYKKIAGNRKEWMAQGRCSHCGAPLKHHLWKQCERCREYTREKHREYKARRMAENEKQAASCDGTPHGNGAASQA